MFFWVSKIMSPAATCVFSGTRTCSPVPSERKNVTGARAACGGRRLTPMVSKKAAKCFSGTRLRRWTKVSIMRQKIFFRPNPTPASNGFDPGGSEGINSLKSSNSPSKFLLSIFGACFSIIHPHPGKTGKPG